MRSPRGCLERERASPGLQRGLERTVEEGTVTRATQKGGFNGKRFNKVAAHSALPGLYQAPGTHVNPWPSGAGSDGQTHS